MVRTIAGFKLTLLKAHTPENAFDGYDPHRHWELLNMPVVDYLKKVVSQGKVYPGKDMADLILSPWQLPWIRDNVRKVGYGFLELVDPQHYGLYSFGNFHDGIDGQLIDGGPGTFIQRVQSGYKNAFGRHATADIYEVEVDIVFELWKTQQGCEAIDALVKKGKVFNPDGWKKTLDQPVPQHLFWTMLERMNKNE